MLLITRLIVDFEAGRTVGCRVTAHLNVVLVQSFILNLNTARRTCSLFIRMRFGFGRWYWKTISGLTNFVRHAFNDSILISIWRNVQPQTNNRVNSRNAHKTIYVFHYFTARVSACRTWIVSSRTVLFLADGKLSMTSNSKSFSHERENACSRTVKHDMNTENTSN